MQKIQNVKCTELDLMDKEDPEPTKEQSIRIGRILDANYDKADLEEKVIN